VPSPSQRTPALLSVVALPGTRSRRSHTLKLLLGQALHVTIVLGPMSLVIIGSIWRNSSPSAAGGQKDEALGPPSTKLSSNGSPKLSARTESTHALPGRATPPHRCALDSAGNGISFRMWL
jgi:hypothetical protein